MTALYLLARLAAWLALVFWVLVLVIIVREAWWKPGSEGDDDDWFRRTVTKAFAIVLLTIAGLLPVAMSGVHP